MFGEVDDYGVGVFICECVVFLEEFDCVVGFVRWGWIVVDFV